LLKLWGREKREITPAIKELKKKKRGKKWFNFCRVTKIVPREGTQKKKKWGI